MIGKKGLKHGASLLALVMLVPLAGCSKSVEGVWASEKNKDVVYVFGKNGGGTARTPNFEMFTWKTDGNILTLTFAPNNGRKQEWEVKYQYKISESTLTLIKSDDKTRFDVLKKID